MQAKILKTIYEKVREGQRAALVVLTNNQGSVPGKDGSVMAVFQDGKTLGTVGGGAIEFDIINRTIKALEDGEDFNFDYKLTSDGELKMACGGDSAGYVKIFYPDANLIIFGAGHVSQKLARIAIRTGFNVIVTDDREEYKDMEDFEGINAYLVGTPKEVVKELNFDKEASYIVVCTRGHSNDQEAIEALLDKDYKYLGMIGSKKKVGTITKNLKDKDFTEEQIKTIHMPIGLDIDDGSVEEIAISIMSEILMVKNSTSGKSNKAF